MKKIVDGAPDLDGMVELWQTKKLRKTHHRVQRITQI